MIDPVQTTVIRYKSVTVQFFQGDSGAGSSSKSASLRLGVQMLDYSNLGKRRRRTWSLKTQESSGR